MALKEGGTEKNLSGLSESILYRIDIPANRYDMLCVEGIATAIQTYLGLSTPPVFQSVTPKKLEQLIVKPEVVG
jgi:phenylalanyl-tRNA synthetase beta chain